MTAVLIDSNILIYGHDPRDVVKHRHAVDLLRALRERPDSPSLSVQCLIEFYNAVRRKLSPPLSHDLAMVEVEGLMGTCTIFDLTPGAVHEACRATDQYQMSFWDALIWAVAKLNQVPIILTEDGQHGRVIEAVRYANPFHPDFDLATLGV